MISCPDTCKDPHCECLCHSLDEPDLNEPTVKLPPEALVFQLLDDDDDTSDYRPGIVVEMVGIGRPLYEDGSIDDYCEFVIWARAIHERDWTFEGSDNEFFYFGSGHLKPLTPAAKEALALVDQMNDEASAIAK